MPILAPIMSTNAVTKLPALDVCFCFVCVYRHQEFQFPLLDAAHCGTESEHQVSNGSLIGLFSLFVFSPFTRMLELCTKSYQCSRKEDKDMAAIQDFRCSLSVPWCRLRTTQETETLDACIRMERMISLSSSWKIHVERCELKMTGVLLSVKLQCSCVLFTGEAMLCHGPRWGGRVL